MDLLWIIENQRSEKSWNEHFRENLQIDLSNDIQILQYINRKLTTRGFQKDENYQISIYILKVIDPEVNAQIQIENEQWLVRC